MNEKLMNGHAYPADEPPIEAARRAEAQLDALIDPIIGNTFNGLFVTVQGLAPEHLARAAARAAGKILGRVICQGNLADVLKVRAAMKESFAAAMDSTRPVPPPASDPTQFVRR